MAVHVGYMLNKMALLQVVVQVLWFFPAKYLSTNARSSVAGAVIDPHGSPLNM
jgi:hypothetical protein